MKAAQNDEHGRPPHLCPLPQGGRGEGEGVFIFALLVLLVTIAYGNSLRNGFVYDDTVLIVKNALITHLETLPKLLASDYWITRVDPYGEPPPANQSGLYRPLVSLTYALNYVVGGLNPMGYHLVNVLLHLGVTWLIYLMALRVRLGVEAAVVAAAIFAVHPLHTEAVTNVAGRAELMMSLGLLASLWFAATGRRWLSWMAFGLSLFSKEQAAMLPVLLVLYDLCFGLKRTTLEPRTSSLEPRTPVLSVAEGSNVEPRTSNSSILLAGLIQYAPYVIMLGAATVVRWFVFGRLSFPPTPLIDNPLAALEGAARFWSTLKVDGLYLQLFIWPASLSPDYSYDAIPAADSMFELPVFFGLLAWGSLVGGMIWSYYWGDRRVTFCLGLTILTFFPVSNLVLSIGTIMGERLFYLPSAGLCLLAGLGYEMFESRLRLRLRTTHPSTLASTSAWSPLNLSLNLTLILRTVIVVICLALTARTIVRNMDWFSDETVFASALQVVPRSAKVYAQIGTFALHKKKWSEAHAHFDSAVGIFPEYSLTESDLLAKIGVAWLGEGDVEQAVETLERAVAMERDSKLGQYNLGLAYAQTERYEDAERAYRRASVLSPKSPEIYNSLSYVLIKQRRFEEAEEMAAEAIRRQPDFPEAHYNRGRALETMGRTNEAIVEYEKVLRLSPKEEKVKERVRRLRSQ